MIRVDNCLVPPGFIAGAQMYSLFFKNQTLYIICTGSGPASQLDYTQGLLKLQQSPDILKNAVEKLVVNSYIKRLKAVEAQINEGNLDNWANNKGSHFFSINDVLSFTAENKETYIKIVIKTAKKKFKFDGSVVDWEEVQKLKDCFNNRKDRLISL